MGCCLSTDTSSVKDQHMKKSPKSIKCGGAPPLEAVPVEEESVKEVLSETPIPKLAASTVEKSDELIKGLEDQVLKTVESTAELVKRKESMAVNVSDPTEEIIISEVSEHSELCSFTESFSTTTTATVTALDKRDDGEEVTQRSPMKPRRKRPSMGDTVGTQRNVRSPARRPAPSPENRKPVASSKPVQGRAMAAQRRNVGPPNGVVRIDSGNGSTRRSRSPATRTEMGSRRNVRYKSPGLGETGRPGGRSPARALENGGGNGIEKQKLQNDNVIQENSGVERQNDTVTEDTSESLENPLVSLECFIFL